MTDPKRPINLVSPTSDAQPTDQASVDAKPDLSEAAIQILRFPEKVTLAIGLALLATPIALWLALVMPRVQEITGAAEASGGDAKEGLLIGVMLAVISVAVSLLASIIRAYAHSESDERIDLENAAVEELRLPMDDAQRAEAEAVKARNRAFGQTDAVTTTYRDHQNAIVDHFWEQFYARHVNDPSVYGTWSDKKAVIERFKVDFKDLFKTAAVLTPKDVEKLIDERRQDRAASNVAEV